MNKEIKNIKSHIDSLYLLTFFLMPIASELGEEESEPLREKFGEGIIMIEEQSRETFQASDCLKLASRWLGSYKKVEVGRVSDDHSPQSSTPEFPKKKEGSIYLEMTYEDKVNFVIDDIKSILDEIEKNSELKKEVQMKYVQTVKYLGEAIFWLEWELERYEEEEENNLHKF